MIYFIVESDFDFFPVNCYNPIGAYYGAIRTTSALIRISCKSVPVSFVVNFTGYRDYFRGTRSDTNLATFAALNVDYYNSSDFSHLIEKLESTLLN